MDYKYYSEMFHGKLSLAEYKEYSEFAEDLILDYVHSMTSVKYSGEVLSYFGDFDKAICYEIDQLSASGSEAISGRPSDSDISSIDTSGFKIQYDSSNSNQFYYIGLPFSPLSKNLIFNELRKNGFTNRVISV